VSTVDSDTVLAEQRGPVLTLTLNRPQRKNAIDPPTWGALHEALRGAELDDAVRAVVLTGTSPPTGAGIRSAACTGSTTWR
jgi:enoyl-CoA hydratase/carnithine racemase